jgi:hypothetical protein
LEIRITADSGAGIEPKTEFGKFFASHGGPYRTDPRPTLTLEQAETLRREIEDVRAEIRIERGLISDLDPLAWGNARHSSVGIISLGILGGGFAASSLTFQVLPHCSGTHRVHAPTTTQDIESHKACLGQNEEPYMSREHARDAAACVFWGSWILLPAILLVYNYLAKIRCFRARQRLSQLALHLVKLEEKAQSCVVEPGTAKPCEIPE